MRRAAAIAAVLAAGAAAAQVSPIDDPARERIVSGLSQNQVAITATFQGSEIFVYGAIERDWFPSPDDPPPDVIVAVEGPSKPVVVRKKARKLGIWVNDESVRIAAAPSFYAVAGTGPLDRILRLQDDNTYRIGADKAVFIAGLPSSAIDPEAFRKAVIRLRQAQGLYLEVVNGVTMEGATLFKTRIQLPSNIVDGDYRARVFLLRDQRVRDVHVTQIAVRKTGLERLIYNLAQERPLIYGLLSILVALLAGWGASEAFRQLRR